MYHGVLFVPTVRPAAGFGLVQGAKNSTYAILQMVLFAVLRPANKTSELWAILNASASVQKSANARSLWPEYDYS